MKNLKTLLLIAVLTLGFNTVQAQNKIAHINLQELIESMSETKKMNDALNMLGKTYSDDIKASAEAFKTKQLKFQNEAGTQTPEENENRELQLKQDARKIQLSEQVAQQELNKKNQELVKPIIAKADAAVKAVAKAQGIDYVIDSSIPTFIVTEGTDLLPLVKTHLGIQ